MTSPPEPKRRGRPKGTGSRTVYENLRNRILALELAPGADIAEGDVANEFGLSRTPVREALVKLEAEGLVSLLPNHGARVVSLDLSEVSETLEALELLQRTVNRWACTARSATDLSEIARHNEAFREAAASEDLQAMASHNFAFHNAVGAACGNRAVAGFYESLLGRCLRLSRLIFAEGYDGPGDPTRYRIVADQHDGLVEAIRNREGDRADKLGATHAQLFRERLLAYVGKVRANEVAVPDRVSIDLD